MKDSNTLGLLRSTTFLVVLLSFGPPAAWAQKIPDYVVASSKHYRESGVGNATGRAGGAAMTARALLGKDGQTTIEVTTGTLDASVTPPGSFGKVQFKPLNSSGDSMFAQNFSPLSTPTGYYSFSWPSLHRKEQVQLQGNITGIDQNRTDVVTIVETTKLRPDLAAKNLMFPASADINQPVNISGSIVEINGDAAATTTCVLAVDGTRVDQINNVYVDAAGGVSCAFTYQFAAAGSHSIQVTAANVIPGDWDTSNNSASGTITISNPSFEHGSAHFYDNNGAIPAVGTFSFSVTLNGAPYESFGETYSNVGREQGSFAAFYNAGCTTSAFAFPVKVTAAETMDGNSVYSYTDTISNTYNNNAQGSYGSVCGGAIASYTVSYGLNLAVDHQHSISNVIYYDSAGHALFTSQVVYVARYAGDVTYLSQAYQCYSFAQCSNPSDYYVWNSSGRNTYGTVITPGATWKASVTTLDAAGATLSGSASVPLTGNPVTYSIPYTCNTYGVDPYGYTYTDCYSANYNYVETAGSGSY